MVALSRKPDESYNKFIKRILDDELASKVKKYDIDDNLDILRLSKLHKYDYNRIKKYHSAWHKINNHLLELELESKLWEKRREDD